MGVLAIAGVDPATDQLHIIAHGLATGDGFLAIYTPDPPGTGAIPAGLAPVTDYWAIRIDADHVKLADSSAHAMAGTAIDITGAGAGTLQLLQGLPFRVPRIAVAGTEIFSADDDAQWQSLVALWNLLTGQTQTTYPKVTIAVPLIAARANTIRAFGIDPVDVIDAAGGGVTHVAGTGGCTVPIGGVAYFKLPTLSAIERLNDLTIWATDLGTIGTLKLMKYDETATAYAASSALHTHPAGGTAVTPLAPAKTAGTVYVLCVEGGDGGVLLKKGEMLVDVPVP